MDNQHKIAIQKIVRLATEDPEFGEVLRKELAKVMSAVSISERIDKNVDAIREALDIRANKSISYDFVANQRIRDQLIVDNLRMENAALNFNEDEESRFYNFCINAFYQVENIVNYWFYISYPDINDLLLAVEQATLVEAEKYRFIRREEKTVSDVRIAVKLDAICNILLPKDNIKITLSQLRQIRNEGEHRCVALQKCEDEKDSLGGFFKHNTFGTIRSALIKLVSAIKNNIREFYN